MISDLASRALNELGVPSDDTPQPIANAVKDLQEIKRIADELAASEATDTNKP